MYIFKMLSHAVQKTINTHMPTISVDIIQTRLWSEMAADSLPAITIVVLIVGYSQLVVSTSELETLLSFVN